MTWYDTSGDPGNTLVRINGALEPGGLGFNPFWNGTTTNIMAISVAGTSPPGQTVPWDMTKAQWWDYQDIGVDWINHASNNTFLAAWGGDARLVNGGTGASGVWTARVTP